MIKKIFLKIYRFSFLISVVQLNAPADREEAGGVSGLLRASVGATTAVGRCRAAPPSAVMRLNQYLLLDQ